VYVFIMCPVRATCLIHPSLLVTRHSVLVDNSFPYDFHTSVCEGVWGSGGIAERILNRCTRWGWAVNGEPHSAVALPAGLVQGPDWPFRRRNASTAHDGSRIRTHQSSNP